MKSWPLSRLRSSSADYADAADSANTADSADSVGSPDSASAAAAASATGAAAAAVSADTAAAAAAERDPAAVLRAHPVLLLAGPPADVMVNRLLRTWNPSAELPDIAEGVRWAGPFRLDTVGAAEAGLPLGWSTAYAARTVRSRMRIPDSLAAAEMRKRYPYGVPMGTEAVAWSLVTGLARRLDGAARLPGPANAHSRRAARKAARNAARNATVQRPHLQQNTYCVYGNEALPWHVLRSLLAHNLPELDRNGALADDDYCLDRADCFEVRVEPVGAGDFLPYALRERAAATATVTATATATATANASWPCTVYRFRALPQVKPSDVKRIDVQLRGAAYQLADVIGGMLLDGEGFPVITELAAQRRR